MFDVTGYLERIGCGGETSVGLESLRRLHKNHLMSLPYNGDIQDLRDGIKLVDIDEDEMFDTCVASGMGGTCFHLARMFNRLLRELGYDVTLMASYTAEGRENFGLDVEHMFNLVTLEGRQWLVDVGYPGPSFLEPLSVSDKVQTQYGCQYRLVEHEEGFALQRRGRVSRWSTVYTFVMKPRKWSDWRDLEIHLNREFASYFEPGEAQESEVDTACAISRGTDRLFEEIEADMKSRNRHEVLCGRTFENGQVVLKGRRYLTVRDGREEVRTITDDEEHDRLISSILSGDFR
ncbi:arylamine N-acetyltransferase [Actinacidiphila oryziradicis]|uniref:Arylamine N-acetyltransferase n=1 Tax=Actinacidiphila oryziradicis TaxID=2571141 RepID=A0A4U0S076_9ACTN|nr:arylamine N-acetyltransferase [Actinacidiphila oryziradicis]TKA01418.1 arylamine N-acetyltransferase [Actinacidiphila oryziradicis]